jgi:hypothetical protein
MTTADLLEQPHEVIYRSTGQTAWSGQTGKEKELKS